MDAEDRKTRELEAEIESLGKEIEELRAREKDLEDTRKAMLYMLEDLNETASALAASKSDWEVTFDSISDPLFIHDFELRILKCNRAFERASGLTFKDVIGKKIHEVFPACENGPCDEVDECETRVGSRVFRVKIFKFRRAGSDENFHVHVMEDITEAREKEEREKTLSLFLQKIALNLDFGYRLDKICETAVDLGYRMAFVGMLNEDAKEVAPMAMAGFEDGYLSNVRIRYDDSPLGMGPVGQAVKSRKPQVLNRLRFLEDSTPWLEQAQKRGYSSVAAIPMTDFEEKVSAVLCVYSGKDEITGDELDFLVRFSAQASVYIKNARLYLEVKDSAYRISSEMELTKNLLTIAQATAHSSNIQKLMDHVAHTVKDIMSCGVCLAYLWEKEKNGLLPLSSAGLSHEIQHMFAVERLDIENEAVLNAFNSRAPALSSFGASGKPSGKTNPFRWIGDVKTLISIPLTGREGILGMIFCLYTWETKRFAEGLAERDRLVFQGISSQVSIAIEEARLFKESMDRAIDLSRKIETIEVMHEIDRTILSTLEPQEMLENGARMVSKLVPCDRATITLLEKEKGIINYTAGFGISSFEKGASIPLEDTSISDMLKTGRPQFVANLKEEKGLRPLERKFLEEGFLSHLRVPLIIKGEIVGTLNLGSRRPAAFTSDDLSTLEKLASQISVALENSNLVSDLNDLFMGTVRSLSEAIDAKSPWTRGHSERVTEVAILIGRELGLSEKELKSLELAGLLHDIGKLGTYEQILDKPGKLTPQELEIIKLHPNKGAEILMPIKQMSGIIPIIRHHHEFHDGSGYPDGLKNGDIPLMSRILTVADTVDAMGADRPYRKGRSKEFIIAELSRCSGTQFDPEVVRAYLNISRQDPA